MGETGDAYLQQVSADLVNGLSREMREYAGYLPLYNGVDRLEIGIDSGAKFEPILPSKVRPMVYYGTSICQGACASRPGIAYTAIIGRMFNEPVINLGFSGSGKMDEGVVDLLAELSPSIYIIDCLPNMNAEQVKSRTAPLIRTLRKAHPETPILLVEDRSFAQSPLYPDLQRAHEDRRKELYQAFRAAKDSGDPALFYLKGDRLLGTDSEGTTDGSHPNDLGMMRYAEALRPAIVATRKR